MLAGRQLTQPAVRSVPHLPTPASAVPQPRVSLQGGLGGQSGWGALGGPRARSWPSAGAATILPSRR